MSDNTITMPNEREVKGRAQENPITRKRAVLREAAQTAPVLGDSYAAEWSVMNLQVAYPAFHIVWVQTRKSLAWSWRLIMHASITSIPG